jgi:hypothetical protein
LSWDGQRVRAQHPFQEALRGGRAALLLRQHVQFGTMFIDSASQHEGLTAQLMTGAGKLWPWYSG